MKITDISNSNLSRRAGVTGLVSVPKALAGAQALADGISDSKLLGLCADWHRAYGAFVSAIAIHEILPV